MNIADILTWCFKIALVCDHIQTLCSQIFFPLFDKTITPLNAKKGVLYYH